MGPGITRWLLIFATAGIMLTGMPTDVHAASVSVCVADFNNTTRFSSYDPLPDNLAFYLIGSSDLKVVERWKVRGELTQALGKGRMVEKAKQMGADVLVDGIVTEETGKVIAKLYTYDLARSQSDAFQVTITDARNCRDTAAKAAAMIQSHLSESFPSAAPLPTVSASPAVSVSPTIPTVVSSSEIAAIESERRELAKKSMRAHAHSRSRSDPRITSDAIVTQEEFGKITARLARHFSANYDTVFTVTDPAAPITISEASAALARGFGSIERYGAGNSSDPVSREGLSELLAAYLPAQPGMPERDSVDKPSGLVIDARGLGMERSMSPIIISEDGAQIYPDKNHLPSVDYIEEQGIASFINDMMNAPRIGDKPLVIRAIGVKGPASQIAVISADDAKQISEAASRSNFLREWKVTFLVDYGY